MRHFVFTNRYLTFAKLLLFSSFLFMCLFSSFHLPPIPTIPSNRHRHRHHQQVYCSIASSSSSSSSSGSCLPMDTFFISHGSPTLSIDDGLAARHFLKSWKARVFQATPRAVLMVSAHWDTSEPTVNAVVGPTDTIYDFYGFPSSMYKIKYPAPGAPDLANRVKELLKNAGFGRVKEDKKRGLDHGAWVPLMLMYPEANIPVCQLSVQAHKDALYHYNLGKALAPLREEGVLIIGSGSATHNLRTLAPDGTATPKWAADFDGWLKDALLNGRYEDINNYLQTAPSAKMAHPWPEHFYPLHVALGAAGDKATAEMIHHSWSNGALSYASYRFKTN